MAQADFHAGDSASIAVGGAAFYTNLVGGVVSLALLAGIGVWGYKLIARDVSGVPVVVALDGEMRVKPADPGGRQASNQGLTVNEVAAQGTAGAPRDTIVLAPASPDLADEDLPAGRLAAMPPLAAPQTGAEQLPQIADTAPSDSVALAETLVEEPVSSAPAIPELSRPAGPVAASLRPMTRPALRSGAPVAAAPAPSAANALEIASLPPGTRVVQLGAFDSEAVARSEWDRLVTRFGDIMIGKQRYIERAEKGGKVFFRLRAAGFTGNDDARRFCSVFRAQNAACIPVLTK
ncbi:MAG: SPOR domain-containing protein [Shimia sp.]